MSTYTPWIEAGLQYKRMYQQHTLFSSPSKLLAGTKQFSKMSSHVSLPRMPSLSSFWAVLKP